MRKVAATILALALATTHGLLEEGGASKGLRGSAEADSSLERAAVGRKLDFYYPGCPFGSTKQADPTKCGVCYNGDECNVYVGCEEEGGVPGLCKLEVTGIPPCDTETCRCCDGSEPDITGTCQFYATVCSSNNDIPCEKASDCPGPTDTCDRPTEGPCSTRLITCCDGSQVPYTEECPTCPPSPPPTPSPTTPQPTPCPKKLDVCIAVDESGSICSTIDDQPELCEDGNCDSTTCTGPPSTICDYESGCSKFNVGRVPCLEARSRRRRGSPFVFTHRHEGFRGGVDQCAHGL